MEENKKYYIIDQKKHIITVDTTIKPSKGDEEAVALYVKVGYDMRIKSQSRVAKMKARADKLDDETILDALKNDAEGLTTYNNIKKGIEPGYKKGFFAARKWYKENKA